MAVNLVVAQVMADLGPARQQGRSVVRVTVTGTASAAGDTSPAFTCPQIGSDIEHVEAHGPLTWAVSGRTVTFTAEAAIGNRVCSATIYAKRGR
jgi:hypothetical protein